MSRKANYHPPRRAYRSAFELLTERMVCAVIKRAAKRPTLSFMETLHERLQAGRPLRELMPSAWEPGGSYKRGGYGLEQMPNGHVLLAFSMGGGGHYHEMLYEVGFGPRGGLRYFKEIGFSMY